MFPMPFERPALLRTALFWDVGNVFDTNCGSSRMIAAALIRVTWPARWALV